MSVVTVLRGSAAWSTSPAGGGRSDVGPAATLIARRPTDALEPPSARLLDGVPITASQHCCGRACKHCRIYRHHMSR